MAKAAVWYRVCIIWTILDQEDRNQSQCGHADSSSHDLIVLQEFSCNCRLNTLLQVYNYVH